MYVERIFNPFRMIKLSIGGILFLIFYSALVTSLYFFFHFQWLKIPWEPITLIGIALAFYLGFKNNSAYDRVWEARKIWGGIVNTSRSWAAMTTGFVTDQYATEDDSVKEIKSIHRKLIYRQIAWLYRLKRQLRVLKEWEHDKKFNRNFRKYIGQIFPTDTPEAELQQFLSQDEVNKILSVKNGCTHIVHLQSEDLKQLNRQGLINDFRHMEMQGLITELYTLQGKCERIKNYPLPRQYASLSIYFFAIFIFLLPMGLLSAFTEPQFSSGMIWGVIPFTTLIGWVFGLMESIGDYTENPFQSLAFDIPMTSLTKTIEIDLKEMLGETDLPQQIGPKRGFVV